MVTEQINLILAEAVIQQNGTLVLFITNIKKKNMERIIAGLSLLGI